MNEVSATIVFEKNWEAIHAVNDDGSRKYRYIINEGSSRSSKTRSIIQAYYLYALQNKQKRLSVWRFTKTDCKATVLKDMQEVYPAMPLFHKVVILNKTESSYNFTINGSTIEICGTDEPNRIHGFNGNVAWFCEPYDISRETFDQIDMRTTDFVIVDWNPKEAHWIDEIKKDPRAIVIHSTYKDNPFCPPEQRTKILSYQPVSFSDIVVSGLLNEQEAKKYDIATNAANFTEKQLKELTRCIDNEYKQTANSFNWSVYGLGVKAERPNRILFWQEISPDKYREINTTKYYGVDWGVVDPFGILEVKYYDGCLYLKELNYMSENQIMEALSLPERQQINATEEGLVMWLFSKLGISPNSVIVCDDNRPQKIRALRMAGFDYAISAVKGTGSVIDGINLLEKLKVYYTSDSPNIRHEVENYSRKVDRYGIVLEEPEDRDNHLIDPTRYVATFLRIQGIIKVI